MREFAALRKKAELSPSDMELHMLTQLLHALRNLVSLLRERTHDALLAEVLGIKLWHATPVRWGQAGEAGQRRRARQSCERTGCTYRAILSAARACTAHGGAVHAAPACRSTRCVWPSPGNDAHAPACTTERSAR